jgi:hypothetical protein
MVIKLHRLIAVEYKDASSINKFCHRKICRGKGEVKVKVKFTLEQAMKTLRGSRGLAQLLL